MKVIEIKVHKVEKDDPRYPDVREIPAGKVVDVYRCECSIESGEQNEAVFFVTDKMGEFDCERAADMLNLFATAVSRMDRVAVEARLSKYEKMLNS